MIPIIKTKITMSRISKNKSSPITKKMNLTITGLPSRKLLKEKMKDQTSSAVVRVNNNYNPLQLSFTLPLAVIQR